MNKYYYIKGDGFKVPLRKKVLDEKQLKELFLEEEIENLKNSIGDKESMTYTIGYVQDAMNDLFSLEEITGYLEDFGYIIEEINEFDFYKYMGITETAYEHSIRVDKEERQKFIDFLKDVVTTLEYDINK